jgi:uncharacterized protein (TIGR02117 family)
MLLGLALMLALGRVAVAQTVTVYVLSNGWHTEIVLPRAALPDGMLPEAVDFPGAAWLSVGWGEAGYFPAPEPTLWQTVQAALWPTPAVLLLTGLVGEPRDVYTASELVALDIDAAGFRRLVAYVDDSFERAGAPRAWAHLAGRHRFSLFYPATGRFHLFNTCNTWTADALAAAGLPVRAFGTMTAEDVMAQIRR